MKYIDILTLIEAERIKQDEQWGGAEHDQKHNLFEWMEFISMQLAHFANGIVKCNGLSYLDTPDAKNRFIKIAALCFAALEYNNE